MSLLVPTYLFKGENSHLIEAARNGKGREDVRLLRIYSVLKPRMELEDRTIWTIAKTVLEESVSRSIDPMLVLAIIHVESGFQHDATSIDGGEGLMQINPQTADSLVKQAAIDKKSLDDPVFNIKLGVFYLWNLIKSFKDLKLALTAYNWGPTQVRNRLAEEEDVPLDYARKVLFVYHSLQKTHQQSH